MSTKIVMIDRENLSVSSVNHRATENRKVFGKTWIEGMLPLVVTPIAENKYRVLSGYCRFTILTGTNSFPCIIVDVDISTPALEQAAIAMYKAQSLSMSLSDVCKTGVDKVSWNFGRYISKNGETTFREDMLVFLEDHNPCHEVSDSDEALKKRISEYNKGLSALIYRACMLGGKWIERYVASEKNITKGLRAAFDTAKASYEKNKDWSVAKLDAEIAGTTAMEKANKEAKDKKDKKTEEKTGTTIDLVQLCASIRQCVSVNEDGKDIATYIIGHLDNVEGQLLKKLAAWFPAEQVEKTDNVKKGNGRK
jgi:hypothetical protein